MLIEKETMEQVVERLCKFMAGNKEKNIELAFSQMRRDASAPCSYKELRDDRNGYIEEGRFDEWQMMVGIEPRTTIF